jgi:hypothetical protein
MKRELFDIWEEPNAGTIFSWRAQMVNYVANMPTRAAAERFVESIKKARAQDAKSVSKIR